MNNFKIIIMDFATSEVHVFSYDPSIWDTGEDFIIEHFSEHGKTFKLTECNWMIVDLSLYEDRLPIYIH